MAAALTGIFHKFGRQKRWMTLNVGDADRHCRKHSGALITGML